MLPAGMPSMALISASGMGGSSISTTASRKRSFARRRSKPTAIEELCTCLVEMAAPDVAACSRPLACPQGAPAGLAPRLSPARAAAFLRLPVTWAA